MANLNKRHYTKVYSVSAVLSASTPEVIMDIAGMYNFSVTVWTSGTATLPYTVYSAPRNISNMYGQITSTNVVGTATGHFTINTFEGNNNSYLKVAFDALSQTGGYASGAIKVIVSYNER